MSKPNSTLIAVVLDASGSMAGVATDTIGSLNNFIEEQKKLPGEAVFTLMKFADKPSFIYEAVNLQEVTPVTDKQYAVGGSTALLDAMGKIIHETGAKLAAMNEEDRPSNIIIVIMTDGYENMSREYKHEQIMNMVTHQQEKYSWNFIFLGAQLDAVAQGEALGIQASHALYYQSTNKGYHVAGAAVNSMVSSSRQTGGPLRSFTNEERDANAVDDNK